jgi:hypothetical protein
LKHKDDQNEELGAYRDDLEERCHDVQQRAHGRDEQDMDD